MDDTISNHYLKSELTKEQRELLINFSKAFQDHYLEMMKPITEFAQTLKDSITESIEPLIEYTKQQQIEIAKLLTNMNKYYSQIPKAYIEKIGPIYNSVTVELQESDSIIDIEIPPDHIKESINKKTLTWEQFIVIISFIISLISFMQSQLPNKQLEDATNALNQLVEIQIQLLEQQDMSDSLSE
jgi:hypothetical protein